MPVKTTIYHVKDGAAEMWAIDADNAIRNHSKEWSRDPWPEKASKPTKAEQDLQAASETLATAEKALLDAKTDEEKKVATAARDKAQADFDALSSKTKS